MLRFIPISILVSVSLLCCIAGCKEKIKPDIRQDRQFIQYQKYDTIYKNYGRVSMDTTKTQLQGFLKLFPTDARAWAFYGHVWLKLQQPDSAITAFRRVIAYNPRYSFGYSALGAVFLNQHQNDSAEYYLLRALRQQDSSSYTYLNLALLFQQMGKRTEALRYADSALQMKDISSPGFAGLAYLYHLTGKTEQQDSMFRQALRTGLKDSAGFTEVLKGEKKLNDFYRENNDL